MPICHASTRRELLLASGVLFAWAFVPRVARAEGRDPRFLTIVLRGGLDGLAGFGYAWMLTWLHRSDDPADEPDMSRMPFLLRKQQRRIGLFATRAPSRINSIGLSLIQILGVTGTSISFAGVDVIDRTPVLDIKPYVTRFDRPPGDPRCGWFDDVTIEQGVTPAQLAPPQP